ncbi:YrdB family protein [Companilactobacillus sp.]|uniref:YrdB family protein n=1 Tax=Companilactobacillus sp. TaxID=2767905 RepID=UPI0025C48E2B|nr:YrdB family protein [Companilactobacillus sp.]MCH4009768.1 YrdB family protein [Companilactobacillus sp.]MCH4052556.1 YrdB family protein [Companilactobacillus sp.]MCH4077710.1 YrdB family protein [Companilactobacillus sp.]MCH4126286.1 YrdB family protein [Companilactobacillus sp.]MCI1311994.1 YrdB family protein [Companilactobacillus sp.]
MRYFSDSLRIFLESFSVILLIINGTMMPTVLGKILFVLVLPLLIVLYWAEFMAPKSKNRVNEFTRLISEIVIFGGLTIETFGLDNRVFAISYLILVIISELFEHTTSRVFFKKHHRVS